MDDPRGVDLALRAKQTAELRSTVRVYRKEFLFDARYGTGDECAEVYAEKLEGRVLDEDVEMRVDDTRAKPYEVWVRLWNVKGEFKHEEDAEEFAKHLEGEVRVVDRNSRDEHVLLNYGKVKLPA